ncbi:MAG TPA: N-acetylmuramoyl-L-alanine amidase [Bacteroidia bacterium]|nr:N-acetylmuramoyl-L-alanine amidase [Bacteroidia bacterium]
MRKYIFLFILFPFLGSAQSIKQCRQRFDSYLNFRGSLNNLVKFDENSISIYNEGKKEFTIYQNELEMMAEFFEHTSLKQQKELLKLKGNSKYTKRQRDSVWIYVDDRKKLPKKRKGLPLQGYRVALDPGHFSTNMSDAEIEGKFLYFGRDSLSQMKDSVRIFESELTFLTAQVIKNMLEEQGATVLISRDQADHTSFNCTYSDWIKNHKQRVIDSLIKGEYLLPDRGKKMQQFDNKRFFWEFFRDWDLQNRAKVINQFNPHVTAVIHYNVDEKNEPWKTTTKKNYTMCFVGGAFTGENFEKAETRIHFLRLLLTKQLNQSEKISFNTVQNFNKLLNVEIAGPLNASYLKDNCISLPSSGVFARNLVLCRLINSPMVYGEALYQDNEIESVELMKRDVEKCGIKVNQRLLKSAVSYYGALYSFLKTL